jgi:catechol 2,3-dioxygenase-like lactoylglutathione lyase family enzyme
MNLNQVTVPVINIPIAINFYQTLGLKLIVQSPHYARFECPDGDATFSIHLTKQLPKGEGIVVYFECKNLDTKVEELIKQDFKFEELPNDKSWLWREARLKDPDENQIILYFAGENRKNPSWRIQ